MPEEEVGVVKKFFAKPVVAGIELSSSIKVGDTLLIKGHTTDIQFMVGSIQMENRSIEEGKVGDLVGIKIPDRCREGDKVYRFKE